VKQDLIKVEDVPNVLDEIEDAFYDIPFGNSEFQIHAFVVAAQRTPARAYRIIGLQLLGKIDAIRGAMYAQELSKIEIEEKEAQLEDPDLSRFERRKLELELKRLQTGEKHRDKLLNDALTELSVLYNEFKRFPRYTRAQFEAEEPAHYELSLNRQIQASGAMESLLNMKEDLPMLDARIKQVTALLENK
jgi:hypothetical protein